MLSTKFLIPTILTLLISTVQPAALGKRATTADVITADGNLVTQTNTADASIVAIDGNTPTATKQKVPTTLQNVNLAIVNAQNSLTPTPATSDPATESSVARAFGRLANTVQNMAADLINKKVYLAPVPNLQMDTRNQIGYLDDNFRRYTTFHLGLVTEQVYQQKIQQYSTQCTDIIANAKNAYA